MTDATTARPSPAESSVALSAVLAKGEGAGEWRPETDTVVVWLCGGALDADTGAGPVDVELEEAFGTKPQNVVLGGDADVDARAAVGAALAAAHGGADALDALAAQLVAMGLAKPRAAAGASEADAAAASGAEAAAAAEAEAVAAAATFVVPGFEEPLHPADVAELRERTKPLRAYMMTNLAPVLTKGVQAVIESGAEDAVDGLARYLRESVGGAPYPVEAAEAEKQQQQ